MVSNIDSLRKEVDSLQVSLMALKQQVKTFSESSKTKIDGLKKGFDEAEQKASLLQSIRDVSGKKSPAWYEVDIFFNYGDTEPNSGSAGVSSGPFVCTQMQSLYMCTDEDSSHFPPSSGGPPPVYYASNAVGRTFPCTAYFNTMMEYSGVTVAAGSPTPPTIGEIFSSYTTGGGSLVRGLGWNYPEFDFTIQIQGSGRYWTDEKVPAPAFYGLDNPLYLGYEGFIDAFDRVIVTAYPTIPVRVSGFVRFVLFGYEISTKKTISDLLGY